MENLLAKSLKSFKNLVQIISVKLITAHESFGLGSDVCYHCL